MSDTTEGSEKVTLPIRAMIPDKPPIVPMPMMVSGALVKAIIQVMGKIKEVKKAGWNKEGKYEYVMMADVMAAIQDALVSNKLVIAQREVTRAIVQKIMMIGYQFDVYHEEGQAIINIGSHTGACRFEFKSGTTDDKAVSKSYVSAHKYFLLNLFKIPPDDHQTERMTDTNEADAQHGDEEPRDNTRRNGDRGHNGDRDRRDERREPPRDDRRDPPRDDRREDDRREPRDERRESAREPRRDDPPGENRRREEPAHLNRPFDEPPSGRWDDSPPPGDQGREAERRPARNPDDAITAEVVELKRKYLAASNEDDAHDIWVDEKALLVTLHEVTLKYLEDEYIKKWDILPPNFRPYRS